MHILGLDLAKLTFDATLLTASGAQDYHSFPNTPDGFILLHAWLKEHQVSTLHTCMEATNIYWEAIATFLYAQGYTVSVVNPTRIKGFAQAEMQRNKTDKLDSAVIAAFCLKHHPDAWQPPSDAQRRLRALARHRDDLIETRLQQENRLRDTTDRLVVVSLEAVLAMITTQLEEVERMIKEHVKTHGELVANVQLLTSIVGIGVITAVKVLAEFAEVEQYESAKAAAADAGVTPSHHESGTSVRRRSRMSKIGKAGLRAALYWPAITAMRCSPQFKAFAERLSARGKAKKVVIGAVMRKLIHIIYGVLKHKTPYDPTKVLGPAPTST